MSIQNEKIKIQMQQEKDRRDDIDLITKTDKEMRLASSHEQCACNSSSKQNSKIIKTKLDTVQEEKEEEEKENTRTHTPPEQIEERKEVQSQLVIAEKGRHRATHNYTQHATCIFRQRGQLTHFQNKGCV